MSGSTSIVRAEEKALTGNNESQDSQKVLDAYQQLYGVGLVSVAGCRVPWELEATRCPPVDMLTSLVPQMSSSPPQDDKPPFYKYHPQTKKYGRGAQGKKKGMCIAAGFKVKDRLFADPFAAPKCQNNRFARSVPSPLDFTEVCH